MLLVCVLSLQLHTRPRVQRAPGIPHALKGARDSCTTRAQRVAGMRTHIVFVTSRFIGFRHLVRTYERLTRRRRIQWMFSCRRRESRSAPQSRHKTANGTDNIAPLAACAFATQGISRKEHDRSLSGLCIPYVARAETVPASASADRYMYMSSVVGRAGGGDTNCERCAT